MPVTVQVSDPGAGESVLDEVFEDFAQLDAVFSPFLEGSAVSRINRGELKPSEAGPLVEQAIELCRHYEAATGGYFSAWIGERFDPSGLVKGWAIDRSAQILDRHGCRSFFVDAAGDVLTRGDNGAGSPWRVGVRHPVERDRVVCVINSVGLAVATSGTYEKGDHILDPYTARPATGLLSFTVVGPDILSADVYATACFAIGEPGLEFIAGQQDYEAFAITPELGAIFTSGFPELCAVRP